MIHATVNLNVLLTLHFLYNYYKSGANKAEQAHLRIDIFVEGMFRESPSKTVNQTPLLPMNRMSRGGQGKFFAVSVSNSLFASNV